jgi:cytochrome c oxidase subunit 4
MSEFTKTVGEGDDHAGVADKIGTGGHSPIHVHAHSHGHGASHHAKDHHPHVLPYSMYFATWISLLVLTGITVGASYVDLGAANIIVALAVATLKATLVALLFMHLFWDHKFHAIIFSFSLIFLGVFIFFTMYDTETRGRTDAAEAERPVDISTPFTGGDKTDAKYKKDHAAEIQVLSAPGNAAHNAPSDILSKPPQSN